MINPTVFSRVNFCQKFNKKDFTFLNLKIQHFRNEESWQWQALLSIRDLYPAKQSLIKITLNQVAFNSNAVASRSLFRKFEYRIYVKMICEENFELFLTLLAENLGANKKLQKICKLPSLEKWWFFKCESAKRLFEDDCGPHCEL